MAKEPLSFEEASQIVLSMPEIQRIIWHKGLNPGETERLTEVAARAYMLKARTDARGSRIDTDIRLLRAKAGPWLAGLTLVCGTFLVAIGRDGWAYAHVAFAGASFLWGWNPALLRKAIEKIAGRDKGANEKQPADEHEDSA